MPGQAPKIYGKAAKAYISDFPVLVKADNNKGICNKTYHYVYNSPLRNFGVYGFQ